MIVLDRDVVAKLSASNQSVIQHLEQYSGEEWTISALVAWETYTAQFSYPDMQQTQRHLQEAFDRILDFTDDIALQAAHLDERFQTQGVSLDTVDLLHLATADVEGGSFVTHNERDFDKKPIHDLVDVDVVYTTD